MLDSKIGFHRIVQAVEVMRRKTHIREPGDGCQNVLMPRHHSDE